jgi:hypothetical protein
MQIARRMLAKKILLSTGDDELLHRAIPVAHNQVERGVRCAMYPHALTARSSLQPGM